MFAVVALTVTAVACSSDGGDSTASTDSTTTTAPLPSTTSTLPPGAMRIGVIDLDISNCYEESNDPAEDDRVVYLVPCEQAHHFEVYQVLAYAGEGAPLGSEFPGELAVKDWSEAACLSNFQAFVGTPWELSELDFVTWFPSQQSWETTDDRTVVCVITRIDGETVIGTSAGAAI